MLKQEFSRSSFVLEQVIQCWPNGMENHIHYFALFIELLTEKIIIYYITLHTNIIDSFDSK
jgi:hypothetical protein